MELLLKRQTIHARSADISFSGLYLLSPEAPPPRELIRIRVKLGAHEAIDLFGMAVHIAKSKTPKGDYGAGIQLFGLDPSTKKRWEENVRQLHQAEANSPSHQNTNPMREVVRIARPNIRPPQITPRPRTGPTDAPPRSATPVTRSHTPLSSPATGPSTSPSTSPGSRRRTPPPLQPQPEHSPEWSPSDALSVMPEVRVRAPTMAEMNRLLSSKGHELFKIRSNVFLEPQSRVNVRLSSPDFKREFFMEAEVQSVQLREGKSDIVLEFKEHEREPTADLYVTIDLDADWE